MPHLLVLSLLFYFFSKTILIIGTHSLLVACRRNIGESTCGEFFSSTCFKSKFTKGPNIFPSSRNVNFTKDSITPSQVEAPVSPGMNPSSPQPEASNLPRTPPASPQLEALALPGTPQTPPQLITQELPLEPEQIPSLIQEARNEVSMGIQFCYFFNKSSLIRQSFQDQVASPSSFSFIVDDLAAEKGDQGSSSQALSEEN
jgi:hypothetical protein